MPRILIIDDDILLNRLLEDHLVQEGFEVSCASLGSEGVEMAAKAKPDFVFVDILLPDETGYKTCSKLRQIPGLQSAPIVMITSSAKHPGQQAIGRIMGATDYMVKPFQMIEAEDRIHRHFGTKPAGRTVAENPQEAARPPQRAPVEFPEDAVVVVDSSRLIFTSAASLLFE